MPENDDAIVVADVRICSYRNSQIVLRDGGEAHHMSVTAMFTVVSIGVFAGVEMSIRRRDDVCRFVPVWMACTRTVNGALNTC